MKIGKSFEFSAGHHLPRVPEGHKCRHPHGHNYKVDLTLDGPVDPAMGWVMDFGVLSTYAKAILETLDHKYLNDLIENPTTENLAVWIWDTFQQTAVANEDVEITIRVWETPKCWAEVSG